MLRADVIALDSSLAVVNCPDVEREFVYSKVQC